MELIFICISIRDYVHPVDISEGIHTPLEVRQ